MSADVAASFSIWRLVSGVLEESAWADSHDAEETGYFLQTDTERTNRDDCNRAGDPDNLLVLERLYAQTPKPENQSGQSRGLLKSQSTRDHMTDEGPIWSICSRCGPFASQVDLWGFTALNMRRWNKWNASNSTSELCCGQDGVQDVQSFSLWALIVWCHWHFKVWPSHLIHNKIKRSCWCFK